eukprot:COSAG02_NODE_61903_length_267_cov_0.755952_1_plen_40_part_10
MPNECQGSISRESERVPTHGSLVTRVRARCVGVDRGSYER